MEKLYENIRRRRKELHMTQEEFAEKMGYNSRSAVSRLENGDIDLPYSRFLKAAEVLDIDPLVLSGLDKTAVVIAEFDSLTESMRLRARKKEEADGSL